VVAGDEAFEEPAVPEYLIAERRQRDGRRGGRPGGRGRGGAYAAALDRERFGGGRGSTPSRFAEPPPRGRDAGFNRDDRRDRERGDRPPFRSVPRPAPRGSGDEPWSEVPPEIEAMLRAQLDARPSPAPRREEPAMSAPATTAPAPSEAAPATKGNSPRRGRKSSGGTATGDVGAPPAAGGTGTGTRRDPARRSRASNAEAPAEGFRTRGQRAAVAAARAMLRGGMPHALLLTGPTGAGKSTLANDIAAALLCRDPDPARHPCRECRSCRALEHDNHPDLHRLG